MNDNHYKVTTQQSTSIGKMDTSSTMDQEQPSFPEMEKMIHSLSVIGKITIPKHRTPGESDTGISSYAQRRPKELPPNRMGPREQEEAGKYQKKFIKRIYST